MATNTASQDSDDLEALFDSIISATRMKGSQRRVTGRIPLWPFAIAVPPKVFTQIGTWHPRCTTPCANWG